MARKEELDRKSIEARIKRNPHIDKPLERFFEEIEKFAGEVNLNPGATPVYEVDITKNAIEAHYEYGARIHMEVRIRESIEKFICSGEGSSTQGALRDAFIRLIGHIEVKKRGIHYE